MSERLSASSVHVQVESDKDPCSLSNDRTILLDTHCCNHAVSLHLVGEQKGIDVMKEVRLESVASSETGQEGSELI
jgi:hypothetical protein